MMVINQTVYETKDGRTTKVESDQLESSVKNDDKKNKKSELKSEEEFMMSNIKLNQTII